MATLCFCPPESWDPRSPTSLSKPLLLLSMKANASDCLAAFSMSSGLVSELYSIFSAKVPLKRLGSWLTGMKLERI